MTTAIAFPMLGSWYHTPKDPWFLEGFESLDSLLANNNATVVKNSKLFIIDVSRLGTQTKNSLQKNLVYEALVYQSEKTPSRMFFEIEDSGNDFSILKALLSPLF